jgi:hypothetical protein
MLIPAFPDVANDESEWIATLMRSLKNYEVRFSMSQN